MTKESHEDKQYPVKSLHDFLFELDKEWTKFRNGTLISLVSSGFLFLLVVWLILRIRHLGLGLIGFCSADFRRRIFRLQHLRHVLTIPLL